MNMNQRFDDNIKEQFQDYSPEVHPRIWENIVKEREKRKPVGFWVNFFNGRNILLLTALLIATGSGAYLLLKTNDSSKDKNTIASTAAKNTTAATNTNTNNEKTNGSAETIADAGSPTNNATATITDAGTPTNNAVANNNSNSTTIGTTGNNNTNAGLTTFHTSSTTGASRMKVRAGTSSEEDNETVTNRTKNKKTTGTDYEITDADLASVDPVVKDIYLRRLLFTEMQKITADKKMASLNKRAVPNIFLPGCPTFEKDAAGNKTYIEIYGGPDIAFRSLSDTGNSVYLQKRKESTKFSSAFSAGIRYTRVFNNGVSIRTGVNFSQINEKFTYVQGNLVQITYIIDANGDTTGSYITTGTRYKTTINKFRTIDVPLLIGYELGNGRLHANINAGVIVNVYSWQKGEVLDSSFKPVSITTGKTSSAYQFKTNIGMGFMIGTSFYYKLNEKIHLMAEPYFRYNLSPMSKEKLTFTQKYNTAGIRFGVRVDLH